MKAKTKETFSPKNIKLLGPHVFGERSRRDETKTIWSEFVHMFFHVVLIVFSVDECNRKERAENKHGWLSRRNDEIITVVAMTTRTYFAHTLPAHFHSLFAHFLHTKFLIENSVCISCLSCVFVFSFSPKMKTMTMSMIEWKNRVNEKKSTRKESTTSEYHQMIFHMHAMFSHRRRPEKQNAERINTFYGVVFFSLFFSFYLYLNVIAVVVVYSPVQRKPKYRSVFALSKKNTRREKWHRTFWLTVLSFSLGRSARTNILDKIRTTYTVYADVRRSSFVRTERVSATRAKDRRKTLRIFSIENRWHLHGFGSHNIRLIYSFFNCFTNILYSFWAICGFRAGKKIIIDFFMY